jgi:DMSO/TMAO reductase YedYZ molybdopterin-dependent catalytic subunit
MNNESLELTPVSQMPFNAETPFRALVNDLTSTELFYVRNHFNVPKLNFVDFFIEVNGAVAAPQQLYIDELEKFPERNLTMVMECAGNGRSSMDPPIAGTPWNLGAISQASFSGTALHNVLELAGPNEDVVEVKFTGSDAGELKTGQVEPYARSLPLEVALHPDTLLVWKMNNEPLSSDHGYPLRLIVPNWYGMASVKWLREITVLTEPFEGFFQTKEYIYLGETGIANNTPVSNMRVRSLILEPKDESISIKDTILVSGIAWSGDGSLTKVELSFDEGKNWIESDITETTSSYGAIRWTLSWNPERSGPLKIIARASDSQGNVQPLTPRWNQGGYGNNVCHAINVTVSDD